MIDRVLDALLPALCPACDANLNQPGGLCAKCLQSLRPLGHQCHRCALPLPALASSVCGHCQNDSTRPDYAWAGFDFNTNLRGMVHALKFHHKLVLAPLLGQQLAQRAPDHFPGSGFDALIPAPLHISRLRERGFNQALELCRPLASSRELTIRTDLLTRCRPTPKQTRLNKHQRQANVRNAFRAHNEVKGMRVVIFDDVMTTGATIQAMTQTLRRAGAAEVAAATLARVV